MDEVARFFGWFCIAVLCMGVACALFALAAWTATKLVQRFENAGAARARREVGFELISGAHWFSESKATMDALRLAGERVRDGYRFDPSEVRDAWRLKGAGP